jgi:hypothetical protein
VDNFEKNLGWPNNKGATTRKRRDAINLLYRPERLDDIQARCTHRRQKATEQAHQ